MQNHTGFIQMSPQAFAALGMQDVAYVKTVLRDGRTLAAIHAADGTEVAVMESREVAIAAVRQNGLEALSAH